jgi:hypothetical protein
MADGRVRVEIDLHKAVDSSLQLLFANDSYLLEADVAERAVAAKLASHLARHFPQHRVDVEYNRHGLEPKMVNLPTNCRGGGRRRIYPDIVVHLRGNDDENLLVIQIKKETNHESRDCDRSIIAAMKREFGYRAGLLVELPAGAGATQRKSSLNWF